MKIYVFSFVWDDMLQIFILCAILCVWYHSAFHNWEAQSFQASLAQSLACILSKKHGPLSFRVETFKICCVNVWTLKVKVNLFRKMWQVLRKNNKLPKFNMSWFSEMGNKGELKLFYVFSCFFEKQLSLKVEHYGRTPIKGCKSQTQICLPLSFFLSFFISFFLLSSLSHFLLITVNNRKGDKLFSIIDSDLKQNTNCGLTGVEMVRRTYSLK